MNYRGFSDFLVFYWINDEAFRFVILCRWAFSLHAKYIGCQSSFKLHFDWVFFLKLKQIKLIIIWSNSIFFETLLFDFQLIDHRLHAVLPVYLQRGPSSWKALFWHARWTEYCQTEFKITVKNQKIKKNLGQNFHFETNRCRWWVPFLTTGT